MTENSTKLAIIDLDGVTADNDDRHTVAWRDAMKVKDAFMDAMNYEERERVFNAIFYSGAGLFNPEYVKLDKVVQGAAEVINRLITNGWIIIFQSSRPESMRAATVQWLFDHQLPHEYVVLKPDVLNKKYLDTPTLKAVQLESIIAAWNAGSVVYVDDDSKNRDMVERYAGEWSDRPFTLKIYEQLSDVVE